MHLKDDNIPAHSEVMNQRISVCLVAIFLFSMVLPFAEHEENGTTHTTVLEEIDTPRFTSSSMNSPMMLSGSIYSNQTLALGSYGSCAILDDRNVWCWGSMYNSVMDLSWNSTSYAESPYKLDKMELPNGTTAVSIDTGGQGDVCVILNNSNLSCWGSNYWGVRGDGTTGWNYTPNEFTLPGGLGAKAISLGKYGTTCAIGEDLNAYCWGNSERGKIGHGNNGSSPCGVSHWTAERTCELNISQVLIPNQKPVISIVAGDYHTCAITDDNDLYCWGGNRWGQLGDGTCSPDPSYGHGTPWSGRTCTGDNRSIPYNVPFAGGVGATSVSLDAKHTCATLTNRTTACWGDGLYGVLGQGVGYPQETANYHTPQTVSIPSNVRTVSVSVSDRLSCALSDAGDIYCWGFHEFGGLGNGTRCPLHDGPAWCNANGVGVSTPTKVNDSSDRSPFVGIVLGHQHACAITESGNIECWGHNQYGQLGRGYECDSFSSTQITYTCTENHDPSETWSPMRLNLSSNDVTNSTGNELALHSELDPDGDGFPSHIDRYPLDASRSVHCERGQYGSFSCVDAWAGSYVDVDGALSQTPCPAGTSSTAIGASNISTCVTVNMGFYAPEGSAYPLPCPDNTATNTTGAESRHDCLPDYDGDGINDINDPDRDGDGLENSADACPWNDDNLDLDRDGTPDGCDDDRDGDGVVNDDDHFPDNSSESSDTDRDGIGNNADLDDDGDGVDDIQDACPLDDSETIDTDGDGVCNGDDSDDDGDGFSDEVDEFPLDESEWADLDGDEIGDNADTDPDGDGIDNLNLSGLGVDECPMTYGTANHLRGCLDSDSDGVSDAIDECPGEIGPGITAGCPDRDGDGYADRVDAYPDDEFRWADTDGDGYADSEDACPDEAGTSSEDRWGCPDRDGDGFSDENDEDPNDAEVTVTPGLVRTALNQQGRVNHDCGGGSHFAIAHKPLGTGVVGVGMTAIIHNGQQRIQLYDENGWTSSPTFSQSIPWNSECRSGGGQPELVIDSEGVVHVLYWSSYAPTGLYYVKWDGNEMVTTAIEESNHRHRGTGVGMTVHDGTIHIVWNGGSRGNVKYASSTNGVDWNEEDVTYSAEENFFGGADVAIGMNGDVHITFSWYSIFDYSYDGRHAYQGEDGVFYVKKEAGETFTATCVPSGGCMVQESHTAQKMAWLVGEPNRFDAEKTGCAYVRGYDRVLCNYNHVVRAPKIVASINSPAVHIGAAGCSILNDECYTANSMWVFSSIDSGDSWSKAILSSNSGECHMILPWIPTGIFSVAHLMSSIPPDTVGLAGIPNP